MSADNAQHTLYYTCKYVPKELLEGFSTSCQMCEHEPKTFEVAERMAHANLCGYGKALLALAQKKEIKALVLTSCCDVMRRVYDLLKEDGSLEFLWMIDLPHRRGPEEVKRFRNELAQLAYAWQEYSGETFDIGRALASFESPLGRSDKHITLMGAHANPSLMKACEKTFGYPVENVTCTGPRRMKTPPTTLTSLAQMQTEQDCEAGCCDAEKAEQDPLEAFLDWYAEALLNQLPCMRMDDVEARNRIIGTNGQAGVIYHTMKFCDYYGFEYAETAKEADVAMLKIETDGTAQSAGQLRTRLEAFDETLTGDANIKEALAKRTRPDNGHTYVMGVDSGSTSTDAVIFDGADKLVASTIVATGAKAGAGAQKAIDEVLEKAGLSLDDMTLCVATGYGRDNIPHMDASITEITCHARGAHFLAPDVMSVIDIGGQDSKVIHLDENGAVVNFVMNDKCAAGTGRFLETMARTMEMPLDEFCTKGLDWKHEVTISSMCTVFAESEVVSLVADDTPIADIIHGLDMSVAKKTAALAKRVHAEPGYLMTGGVAHNAGVVQALSDVLGTQVQTHEDSQLCGAIGAALLGLESLGKISE